MRIQHLHDRSLLYASEEEGVVYSDSPPLEACHSAFVGGRVARCHDGDVDPDPVIRVAPASLLLTTLDAVHVGEEVAKWAGIVWCCRVARLVCAEFFYSVGLVHLLRGVAGE